MHRPSVGLIALVLLIGAVALLFPDVAGLLFDEPQDVEVWRSACVRVGILMGAVWLAHPHLVKIHPKLIIFGLGLGVVILVVAAKHPLQIAMLGGIALLLGYLRIKTREPERKAPARQRQPH